jgi:hypothetical protein
MGGDLDDVPLDIVGIRGCGVGALLAFGALPVEPRRLAGAISPVGELSAIALDAMAADPGAWLHFRHLPMPVGEPDDFQPVADNSRCIGTRDENNAQ